MFKRLRILVVAFIAVSFLFSCQKEDLLTELPPQNSIISLEIVNFEDFKKSDKHNTELLQKALRNINPFNSKSFSSDDDFLVDSTEVLKIEHKDGYTSFTIPIITNPLDSVISNITISKYPNGISLNHLVEYKTDRPIGLLNSEDFQYHITKSRVTQIADSDLNFRSKSDEVCFQTITTRETQCSFIGIKDNSEHKDCFLSDGVTPKTIITTSIETECIGGGGDRGTTDTNPPNDDGFSPFHLPSGGGNSNPINNGNTPDDNNDSNPCETNGSYTSIDDGQGNCIDGIGGVLLPILETPSKDCEELVKNSGNLDFNKNMRSLNIGVYEAEEKSFGIYNGDYFVPKEPNPSIGDIVEGNESNGGNITWSPQLIAIAHNHLKYAQGRDRHLGTFSPNDLIALSNLAITHEDMGTSVKNYELGIYLICDEGSYSLKINDIDKLYNFALKYGSNEVFKKRVDRSYTDNNISHGKSKKKQNIGFLSLMKDFNLGVDLYEADDNYNNWEQLKLNDSNDDYFKEPCK